MTAAGPRGIIARGLGRSYGDPAQNAGGTVLDMTGLATIHSIDAGSALVVVDAGVSLDTLMRAALPSRAVAAGAARHPPGDRRRRDRRRHPRQGAPRGGQLRQPRRVAGPGHRGRATAHADPRRLRGRPRRGAVLGHRRRDGPDRRDHPGHAAAAPRGDRVLHGGHRADRQPRRADGPPERGRRALRRVGLLVRRGDHRQALRPRPADAGQPRHASPSCPPSCAPTR